MTVHNIAEYVKYHQEKLREQNRQATSSASSASPPKPKSGVNQINSKKGFDTSVIENSKEKLVVVDFFATWCGPCKVIAPKIIEMSGTYPNADFYKIDVDELQETAAEQGITAMPTFKLYKGGEEVETVIGANPQGLKIAIDRHYNQ